jgi:hypothetical protein
MVSTIIEKAIDITQKLLSSTPLDSKQFTPGGPLFAGDTMMGGPSLVGLTGPQIIIKNDGTGTVDGNLRSSDTGDEINFAFDAYNGAGQKIFHVPTLKSPFGGIMVEAVFHFDISDAGVWKPFHWDFTYDASLYNSLLTLQYGYTG